MRTFWSALYNLLLLPLLLLLLRLLAPLNKKLGNTLRGHRGLWTRLQQQLQQRDENQPLYWFHVASAGEYLQAMPVIERALAANIQCALTITSVSGYNWAIKKQQHYPGLIITEYLPTDTRGHMKKMLDTIKPDALIFVKFDLWPNLIWQASKRNIPLFMVSATLHVQSKRSNWRLAKSLYKTLYGCFNGIYAVSEEDSRRFLHACPNARVKTLGDTRFDSVLDRRQQLQAPPLPSWFSEQTILILGSVWPEDEKVIISAIQQALTAQDDLVLLAAPHEINEQHLEKLEQDFDAFVPQRFTALDNYNSGSRVILIDTVGYLSSLYTYADIAYVGGAFGKGVHNTMEPSAMGVPTIVGPFYQNSPEAIDLIERKLAFSIENGAQFAEILTKLLHQANERKTIGKLAKNYIEASAGAADQCFNAIREGIHGKHHQ